MPVQDEARISAIVREAKTVAVLGAHEKTHRAAYYVPAYLDEQGVRCLPVNPRFVGRPLFGHPVTETLAELDEAVDIVDVFRASTEVPRHLEDILAMRPRPKVVWLQLGIRNDEVAAALEAEGIEVVQDRCLLVDHRRYAGENA